jgi:hypothetical protein
MGQVRFYLLECSQGLICWSCVVDKLDYGFRLAVLRGQLGCNLKARSRHYKFILSREGIFEPMQSRESDQCVQGNVGHETLLLHEQVLRQRADEPDTVRKLTHFFSVC